MGEPSMLLCRARSPELRNLSPWHSIRASAEIWHQPRIFPCNMGVRCEGLHVGHKYAHRRAAVVLSVSPRFGFVLFHPRDKEKSQGWGTGDSYRGLDGGADRAGSRSLNSRFFDSLRSLKVTNLIECRAWI